MNKNCLFDRENIAKLIFEKIIKEETHANLNKYIKVIVSIKEDEINIEEKLPLTNFQLLLIINKYIGIVNLLKLFLEVVLNVTDKRKVRKKMIKKRNIKKLIAPKFTQNKKIKAKGNLAIDSEEKDFIMLSMNSNEHYLTQYDINSPSEKIKKEESKINGNINLESSTSSENFINLGVYSEVKSLRKKNIVQNSINKRSSELNSEKKNSKPFKEINKANTGLSFHYTLNNGHLYKFGYVGINEKNNFAIFSCDDPKCKAKAKYDYDTKIFSINSEHSIDYHEHRYIKYLSEIDSQIFDYMKKNNTNDIQLTKANA